MGLDLSHNNSFVGRVAPAVCRSHQAGRVKHAAVHSGAEWKIGPPNRRSARNSTFNKSPENENENEATAAILIFPLKYKISSSSLQFAFEMSQEASHFPSRPKKKKKSGLRAGREKGREEEQAKQHCFRAAEKQPVCSACLLSRRPSRSPQVSRLLI